MTTKLVVDTMMTVMVGAVPDVEPGSVVVGKSVTASLVSAYKKNTCGLINNLTVIYGYRSVYVCIATHVLAIKIIGHTKSL